MSLQKAEEHPGSFVVLWSRCQFSSCLVLKFLPRFLSHFEQSLISQSFNEEKNQLNARNNKLAGMKDVIAIYLTIGVLLLPSVLKHSTS